MGIWGKSKKESETHLHSHSKGVGLAQEQQLTFKQRDNEDLSLSPVFLLHPLPLSPRACSASTALPTWAWMSIVKKARPPASSAVQGRTSAWCPITGCLAT